MDRSNMKEKIYGLPEQMVAAVELTERAGVAIEGEIRNVVVAGMGGSAMAGDVMKAAVRPSGTVPIEAVRYYSLPQFVDQHTLLIIISYSGNTEETLSCFKEGEKTGARLLCISSGGRLAEMAHQNSVPLIRIPEGYPPRSAIGYLTVPLLMTMKHLDIDLSGDIDETVRILKEMRAELSPGAGDNTAEELARSLVDRIPVVYSAYDYGVVAFRWRTQLNENSEVWVHTNLLPELDHNEIVGIGSPADLCSRCSVLFLRDPDESRQMKRRVEVTKEIISPLVADTADVWARGRSTLAKLFSLIYYGDWVSFHLAMARGVDPTPVARIDYLKNQLSTSETSKLR